MKKYFILIYMFIISELLIPLFRSTFPSGRIVFQPVEFPLSDILLAMNSFIIFFCLEMSLFYLYFWRIFYAGYRILGFFFFGFTKDYCLLVCKFLMKVYSFPIFVSPYVISIFYQAAFDFLFIINFQ